MAGTEAGPRDRNRLTKGAGALARELVRAESRLRDERSDRERIARTERFWRMLRAALRRLRGRRRTETDQRRDAPPPGGDAAAQGAGAGQEPWMPPGSAAAYRPGPGNPPGQSLGRRQPSDAEQAAIDRMAGLMDRIQRLPADELKAFEDAVLHLVRSDDKLRRAFEADPLSLPPAIARFAVSAHSREALGDVPPAREPAAPAPPAPDPSAPGREAELSQLLTAEAASITALPSRGPTPSPTLSPVSPVSPPPSRQNSTASTRSSRTTVPAVGGRPGGPGGQPRRR
ncbi:hypothetical protein ACFV5G_33165 [Streptomyces sp. NPDC059766]|uniref:hypothetical protein n=1 Tax=Streptomyces sp. NPDC059766 TaxID=3346940 RepID=UPI00365F133C